MSRVAPSLSASVWRVSCFDVSPELNVAVLVRFDPVGDRAVMLKVLPAPGSTPMRRSFLMVVAVTSAMKSVSVLLQAVKVFIEL